MATVTIGDQSSQPFAVYADVADADLYLSAALHAANWRAATDETKAMALVTATRILDRQRWKGDKTDDDQPLSWPRKSTGLAGVEDDVIPQAIIDASIEIASALVDGTDIQNEQNTSQKIQSLRAGSVALTFFRGAEGTANRFPLIVQELLSLYLIGGSGSFGGVITSGTDGESVTRNDFGLNHGV